MADIMVKEGYLSAGYNRVHIDDCWMESSRSSDGKLVANRTRFPNGMDGLANYIHSLGMGLGIYETVGNLTCEGYPGSWGYEEADAQTFADWGIDYLKYDACHLNYTLDPIGYTRMHDGLLKSGRPIVYSTEWDIVKSWNATLVIIEYFVSIQDLLIPAQGPGFWNDPDMIIVGNDQLTVDQAKVQMSIWSIWSAPLLMSNDLRALAPGHKEILLNKYVIAVDQDPLGIMGRCTNKTYQFRFNDIGLTNPYGYNVMDLWKGKLIGTYYTGSVYTARVNATGVNMIKAIVIQ